MIFNKMYLYKLTEDRNNNLDIIRFVAALLVIFSHSFPLTKGATNGDFLLFITKNQMSFGGLAVSVFFIFSGFLITGSVKRKYLAKDYFFARCIRILPGLWIVVISTVFIIGPLFTSLTTKQYFGNFETYKYLLNCFLILQHQLPGVWQENIYNLSVNGVLWVLPLEFICYVLCFFAYRLNLLNEKYFKYTIPIAAIFFFLFPLLVGNESILVAAVRPITMFYMGVLLYNYRRIIKINYQLAILGAIIICISIPFDLFKYMVILFLPYIVIVIGYGSDIFKNFSKKQGELSYGIYLWGFIFQQILVYYFGAMTPMMNFFFASILATIMSYIINKFIEKPTTNILTTFYTRKRKRKNA